MSTVAKLVTIRYDYVPLDLDQLRKGVALKVPLAQLAEGKEKVRSALNRATRKRGRNVATASDGTFLYVWNETGQRTTLPE